MKKTEEVDVDVNAIKTIIFASDLINLDGRISFRQATKHAVKHNAKLVFLNVLEPISETAAMAVSNYISETELTELRTSGIEKIREDIIQRIKNFCNEVLPDDIELPYETEIIVEVGKPAIKILEVAKKKNADMIVMGIRNARTHRAVLGHTAHKVLLQTKFPVLIVPIG